MRINEDKLPIKYVMGIEKDLPDYPTGIDIIYSQILMCTRNPKRYKSTFTLHALKTYRFPETEQEHLLKSLDEAIQEGLLEQTSHERGKEAYNILLNPFE
jgi:hypothetical protein